MINTNDVGLVAGIKVLKCNKSDGSESLSSNYLILGSNLLFEKMARLCTALLCPAAPNFR